VGSESDGVGDGENSIDEKKRIRHYLQNRGPTTICSGEAGIRNYGEAKREPVTKGANGEHSQLSA